MNRTSNFDEINRQNCKKITADLLIRVGNNVRRMREENNLSQNDVGYYIFSDKSSISNLERGVTKNINLLTLVKLSELFHISLEELLK